MRLKLAVPVCLALLCTALAACAGGKDSAAPVSQDGLAGFGLPAPSGLHFTPARPRGASYADSDLTQLGASFRSDLPNHLVAQSAPDVDFSPDFVPGQATNIDGLAFCMFGFSNLSAYDRDEAVNTKWDNLPADGSCWIGLANWEKDIWDWYPLGADLKAVISPSAGGPLDDYIDFGGGLLLAVVVTGQGGPSLKSVRLGTYPPQAFLTAEPGEGLAPLETTLDASLSSDSDGSIVKFEWDLDGDGIYETDSGLADTQAASFPAVGSFTPGLRLTDNNGASSTASTFVSSYAEWNHTWGKASEDNLTALIVSDDRIYAAGNLDLDGDADLVLQCYSLSGSRLWSKTWNSGDMDIPRSLAVSADGDTIFLAGYTLGGSGGSTDLLLQAWDTGGNLKWTRTWGGSGADYGQKVVVSGGGVFLCGTASSFGNPKSPQVVLLRFDENGSNDWQRMWGGSAYDECYSACLIPTLFGDPTIALAGDTTSFGAGQMDILYLRFDLDGNLSSALTWGDGNVQTATSVSSSLLEGTYVAGWETLPEPNGLVVKVGTGTPSFAFDYYAGVGAYLNGITFDGTDIVVTGYLNLSANFDLMAARINLDTTNFSMQHIAKGGGLQWGQCVARLPDGSFVFGGKDDNNSNIIWESQAATATDRSAIAWESVDLDPATLNVMPQSLSILPTFGAGTSDTGGGSGDMFIGVHKL